MTESDRKFIASTARDYDLNIELVDTVFRLYYKDDQFYEKLEELKSACV